jgi:glutathione S-transferase
MEALDVEIELRDTRRNSEFAEDVLTATGRPTVPVLRIETEDGTVQWMPESRDIISYLQSRFE